MPTKFIRVRQFVCLRLKIFPDKRLKKKIGKTMSDFVQELLSEYAPTVGKHISSRLDIDERATQQIMSALTPMILSGLKQQKDTRGGVKRVDHILGKYGSSDVLNDLEGLIDQKAAEDNRDANLGGLLGKSGDTIASSLGDKLGIDSDLVRQIIPILSPIILGAITKKRDTQTVGSAGIASMLDQDGDGKILDDVAGFLVKGFSQKEGLTGMIGSFFGK